MNETFFISDLHLGHQNMALKRGFESADEMNEHIINSWNSVVNKKDTVYILGDITMEKSSFYYLLDRLKGFKKVILGNHDQPQHVPELLKHVNSVSGLVYLRSSSRLTTRRDIILTHAPIHPQELEYRFNFNIHGHVHENTLPDQRYINVSAEVIEFTPKTLDQLLNR